MKDHFIRVKSFDEIYKVQLTGRADFSSVEVFTNGVRKWLPRSMVLEEDKNRIPPLWDDLPPAEREFFYLPERTLVTCDDSRVKVLVERVWCRLPLLERQILRSILNAITDAGDANSDFRYIFETPTKGDNWNPNLEECPAQLADEAEYIAYLGEARAIEDDKAAMFVIAREFAKINLRQAPVLTVLSSFRKSEAESNFDEYMLQLIRRANEHATLQAWQWGFKEEFEVYSKLRPNRVRESWFQERKTAPRW